MNDISHDECDGRYIIFFHPIKFTKSLLNHYNTKQCTYLSTVIKYRQAHRPRIQAQIVDSWQILMPRYVAFAIFAIQKDCLISQVIRYQRIAISAISFIYLGS